MQFDAITALRSKTKSGNGIKAIRMLLYGLPEYLSLFRRRFELHHYRSIHAKSIPYIPSFITYGVPAYTHVLLPPAQAEGLRTCRIDDDAYRNTLPHPS